MPQPCIAPQFKHVVVKLQGLLGTQQRQLVASKHFYSASVSLVSLSHQHDV